MRFIKFFMMVSLILIFYIIINYQENISTIIDSTE